MGYWISIHHPSEVNESRESECQVWLLAKCRQRPQIHDRVFIYETEVFSSQSITKKEHGKRKRASLRKGAKGLIALVELTSNLKKQDLNWNNMYFNGIYDTIEIPMKRKSSIIPLKEINEGYSRHGIRKIFTPHINTGLRRLKNNETEVLLELVRK